MKGKVQLLPEVVEQVLGVLCWHEELEIKSRMRNNMVFDWRTETRDCELKLNGRRM
jgi:hypothetical protein